MFVINILTSFYHFSLAIKEIYACTQIYKITLCSGDEFPQLTETHSLKSWFIYEGLVTIVINNLAQYKQQFNTLKGFEIWVHHFLVLM